MKPHPRIRKTIKWGGAAVTVLLTLIWAASGWIHVRWRDPSGFGVSIRSGRLMFDQLEAMQRKVSFDHRTEYVQSVPTGWGWGTASRGIVWGLAWNVRESRGTVWAFPLWMISGVLGLATAAALYLDLLARRRAHTHCPKCNYDRAGIAKDAVCPECGCARGSA
jgi:hypothetical protein